jgi:Uncharacterised nucleotidyltransferase
MREQDEPPGSASPAEVLQDFVARVAPRFPAPTGPLDAAAAEAVTAMHDVGVDVLLLKGRALAASLYLQGETRGYSDVDLLVSPDRLAAAERVLTGLGYRNVDEIQGIDDVGGVVYAATWMRSPSGRWDDVMIDLHWGLPGARRPAEITWQALWAQRRPIDVGGYTASTLNRRGQAMHLAIHAAQHGAGFQKPLDELALALERWGEEVWQGAATLAYEVDAQEAFAAGLRLLPEGAWFASRLRLPPTDELDWTIRNRELRPRGTFHLSAFTEARGVLARGRILRRSLLPGRAWITYQYRWAEDDRILLAAAYGIHLLRMPVWAVRAWRFRARGRRSSRR